MNRTYSERVQGGGMQNSRNLSSCNRRQYDQVAETDILLCSNMTTAASSSDIPNIPKLTSSKLFVPSSIYVKELTQKDGVIDVLVQDIPSSEGITSEKFDQFEL